MKPSPSPLFNNVDSLIGLQKRQRFSSIFASLCKLFIKPATIKKPTLQRLMWVLNDYSALAELIKRPQSEIQIGAGGA